MSIFDTCHVSVLNRTEARTAINSINSVNRAFLDNSLEGGPTNSINSVKRAFLDSSLERGEGEAPPIPSIPSIPSNGPFWIILSRAAPPIPSIPSNGPFWTVLSKGGRARPHQFHQFRQTGLSGQFSRGRGPTNSINSINSALWGGCSSSPLCISDRPRFET